MDSRMGHDEEYCGGSSCRAPIMSAVDVVSGRWSVAVIEAVHFSGGAARFGELQRRIEGISPKELTRQLVHLVEEGVLVRGAGDHHAAEGSAAKTTGYALTERGRRLLRHMEALGEWARENEPLDSGACEKATWLDPLRRCRVAGSRAR